MTDRAYIVSRTLENKIAMAGNDGDHALIVTLDVLKEILVTLKEQEAEIKRLKGELHGFGDLFHTLSEKTEKAMAEQPKIVRCKDCVNRGNAQTCPVAYIEKENEYKLIGLDDWFCGNGKKDGEQDA